MNSKPLINRKFLRLEAIRGLAAFYVVLHHTLPHTYMVGGFNIAYAIRFGQEAVILFFLLSGFVINYSYQNGIDKSFKNYFFSRFFRIYIPLIVVYILSYLNFSYNSGSFQNIELKTLLGNLFMLQDWSFAKPNVIVDAYMDNGPLWSLSYEWWFYMLYFPIVNTRLSIATRDKLVFTVCLLFSVAYVMYPYYFVRVIMYLAIWWVGVRLADLYLAGQLREYRRHFLPVTTLLIIVSILVINVWLQRSAGMGITLGRHPLLELRHFVFALVCLVAALVMHKVSWAPFDALTRPFLVFAPISYVLYIVHWPLAKNGEYLAFVSNPYLEWFGYFGVCLVVAYVIEVMVYPTLRKAFVK